MVQQIFFCLMALVVAGSAGASECRVMESRSAYLGYAQGMGLVSSSVRRLKNPYITLAQGAERARNRAQEALTQAASELVQQGRATSAGTASLQEMQERAGVDLLAGAHAADFALIYGSQRLRSDGSLQLAYETVDLKSGLTTGHIAIVSHREAARIIARVCAEHDCSSADVMKDPTDHAPIFKAVLGARVAHDLRCS